jgi:hypothetical protein
MGGSMRRPSETGVSQAPETRSMAYAISERYAAVFLNVAKQAGLEVGRENPSREDGQADRK